eukprot:scaffold16730_cov66-Phaeocystis_antarctica.AAC.5
MRCGEIEMRPTTCASATSATAAATSARARGWAPATWCSHGAPRTTACCAPAARRAAAAGMRGVPTPRGTRRSSRAWSSGVTRRMAAPLWPMGSRPSSSRDSRMGIKYWMRRWGAVAGEGVGSTSEVPGIRYKYGLPRTH